MKYVFNILLIFFMLISFVPPFRRFLFHLLVGRQLMKEQKKAEQRNRSSKKSGINVDFVPPNSNDSNLKGGEYVDYEEIK